MTKRVALFASWSALLTGLLELAWLGFKLLRKDQIFQSRQIVWETPLAVLIVFSLAALLIVLAGRLVPRAQSTQGSATVFGFLSALSLLATQTRFAWWAILVLALGLGIQAGRLVAAFESGALRLMRRTLPVLAAIPLVMAAVVNARIISAERSALAALPAAPAGAPNVLLIVWDAVRAENLSLYGYGRPTTTHLDSLARRGVVFDRAISPSPWTLVSHASFLTGKWPHEMSVSWSVALDRAAPTLAEALAARGWRTGAFSANVYFVDWEHGVTRGFSHAEDYHVSAQQLAVSSSLVRWVVGVQWVRRLLRWYDKPGRLYAPAIRSSFLSWLDRDPGRPFFALLNQYDAHDPYLPPAPYDTMFGAMAHATRAERDRAKASNSRDKFDLTPPDIAKLVDLYDGGIAYLDRDLGLLLDALERRGVLRNTLVIVTSDHGEQFGEHRTFGHGNDVYLEAVHVPLVMALPGRLPAGAHAPGMSSLRDLPATIAEVLNVGGPSWPLPGRSLVPARDTTPAAVSRHDTVLTEVERISRGSKPWYAVRRGNVASIIAWPYHLMKTADSLELFDVSTDPAEKQDLAGLPERRALRDSLFAALQYWRRDAVPSKR